MHADVELITEMHRDEWGEYKTIYNTARSSQPMISVLLSVKDHFIQALEAIESIRLQTHKDLEIILVDDGSKQSLFEACENLMRLDARIVLIQQNNIGLTKSLLRGLSFANGKYVARQDADDISLPHRFEIQMQLALKENCDVVFSRAKKITEKRERIVPYSFLFSQFSPETLKFGNIFIHGTMLIKKDILQKIKYDSSVKYSQDYDLFCRLALIEPPLRWGLILEPLYILKQFGGNISSIRSAEQAEAALSITSKYYGTAFFSPVNKNKMQKFLLLMLRRIILAVTNFTNKVVYS